MEMHRLTEVDIDARRAVCSLCGPVAIVSKGWQEGRQRFTCAIRHERNHHARRLGVHPYTWSNLKGLTCERCGFVPQHPCQLDLHNHRRPEDRQTLCANCHRLVTYLENK